RSPSVQAPEMKSLAKRAFLDAVGLPRFDSVSPDGSERATFEAAADRAMAAGGGLVGDLPPNKMRFVMWLAENRPVVFHGSSNPSLDELLAIRMSRDASAFGDQQAVYATPDPIWAAWFGLVKRDASFRGMRNGSMGVPGPNIYPRWYYLAVHRTDGVARFDPGTLYVLPREGFTLERPHQGLGGGGQMISHASVRPLARVALDPSDVPLLELTHVIEEGEKELTTIRRFAAAHRRSRRGRARIRA
ncbi:MAG TPA: hypothetical protein VMY88_06600, partial [Acidimicrobiales bacterium]|nr:hypothetical protein [Acidimicrobiales bacterium]